MENITGYRAVNGRIIVKTVAQISSITIGTKQGASSVVPDTHFVVSSSVDHIKEGIEVYLDNLTIADVSIKLPVKEDRYDIYNVFNAFKDMTHQDKQDYIKDNPKTTIHAYSIISHHDILAVKE